MQVVVSGTRGAKQVGRWFWCTITAPGADVLPWDEGACRHAPEVPCSGSLGCVVDRFDAAVWNGTAPRRWSWFMTYLRRRFGERVQYFAVWEDQRRGVLHRHFLIRVERPTTERRARAAVRGAARRWGFGDQYDVQAISDDAAQQAWYLAKYSTKTADTIDGRQRLDTRTGEMRQTRGFRPWSCSREWGDSMGQVKARQAAWARAASGGAQSGAGTAAAAAGAVGAGLDDNSGTSTPGVGMGRSPVPEISAHVLL